MATHKLIFSTIFDILVLFRLRGNDRYHGLEKYTAGASDLRALEYTLINGDETVQGEGV